MPVVNVSLPSDNTRANVADYNDPITHILAVVNGQLDDDNIASVNGSKVTDATITPAKLTAAVKTGWWDTTAPSSVTALGNRSYSVVVNSTDLTGIISTGMRIRTVRSSTAPVQCTSLNGTTQYYSKTSPNKMTFTDDFVVSAWIKLSSYGADSSIASRYNGTSGWDFKIDLFGRVQLVGFNAGSSNNSRVDSIQSVPLNKWVHVAAQLDMSAFTASTTTSYTMIDGVDVPAAVTRVGTNPTALVQAGNLEVGSRNGGTNFFPGKIAQVAIYSAKVTQANILATISQGLTGAETSLASGYSFNNSFADLNTTTPNDLSAVASAAATNSDSPFTQDDEGAPSGTVDFGVVQKVSFSTNTTIVVQVPEGCAIPTTGSITSMQYAPQGNPFGFPRNKDRWSVEFILRSQVTTASNANFAAMTGMQFSVPIGPWEVGWQSSITVTAVINLYFALSDSSQTGLSATTSDRRLQTHLLGTSASASNSGDVRLTSDRNLTAATTFTMYSLGATTTGKLDGDASSCKFFANLNNL